MPDDSKHSRRTFLQATTAGAVAAIAGCTTDEGGNGDGNGDGNGNGNGGNGNGNGDDTATPTEEPLSNVEKAQQAWERVVANPAPEDQDVRNEAYRQIEEANRDDMMLLPLFHGLIERFWYDHVDVPRIGAMGGYRQRHDETSVEGSDTLNLRNATISTIDPVESGDTASGEVVTQIYENLVHYTNGTSELENELAEEVEISDDLLTYTFTLKEAEFHNGEELTADDFVYSFRRAAEAPASYHPDYATESGFLGIEHEKDDEGNVVPDSLAVEAVDDRTFEITIQEVEPSALDILAYSSFAAVPEGFVSDIEGHDDGVSQEEFSSETAAGTGPFEFDSWEPGSEAQVTAFDNYHNGPPNVDAVHWQIIEDDDAYWTVINEKNVDIFGVPTPFYEQDAIDASEDDRGRQVGTYSGLENGEEVNYLGVASLLTYYVAFNAKHTPKPVRQAIAHVTDHAELVDVIFKGRGQEAYSFTPPGIFPGGNEAYQDYVDDWPYGRNETDRQGATEVLEEAGYTEDDPYELTLTTYESQTFQEFGRLTRDKLSGLGISLELEEAPFSTLIGRGEDGDLGFYSLGWIWSWADPAYGLYGFEPKNTDTSRMPDETDGYYLDWHAEDEDFEV